jgi:cell division topological specificity factor
MSFLSFLLGEKKRPPASPRSACRSSWRTSAAAAARPARLPARAAARAGGRDLQVREDQPDDIKVQLERQDNLEVLEVKIELPETR